MFGRRNEEIAALGATHADRVVLAGAAAADFAERILANPAALFVVRGVDRLADYFVSLGGVLVVVESDALDYFVGVVIVEGGAGTLDKYVFFGFDVIDEDVGGIDGAWVTIDTNPNALLTKEFSSAVDAVSAVLWLVHNVPAFLTIGILICSVCCFTQRQCKGFAERAGGIVGA